MKKNKYKYYLFILLLGFCLLPKVAFAEGTTTLTFETTIDKWYGAASGLIIPEIPNGVRRSFYVREGDSTYPIDLEPDTLVGDFSETFTFVEEVTLEDSLITYPGSYTISYSPVIFDTEMSPAYEIPGDYQDILYYAYSNYSPISSATIYYTVLNPTDENGDITGSPFINSVYFSEDGFEKEENMSMGTVRIPSACVDFTFHVRGNLADVNGYFQMTFSDSTELYQYDSMANNQMLFPDNEWQPNEGSGICYGFMQNTSFECSSNYTITITGADVGLSDRDSGAFCNSYEVEARYEDNSTDTGIFYNILPFLIGILLLGGGYIFYKRAKIKN